MQIYFLPQSMVEVTGSKVVFRPKDARKWLPTMVAFAEYKSFETRNYENHFQLLSSTYVYSPFILFFRCASSHSMQIIIFGECHFSLSCQKCFSVGFPSNFNHQTTYYQGIFFIQFHIIYIPINLHRENKIHCC